MPSFVPISSADLVWQAWSCWPSDAGHGDHAALEAVWARHPVHGAAHWRQQPHPAGHDWPAQGKCHN
eukprot:scaffold92202_cov41-Prasinocladus_malaysianus.AAC.2